MTAARTRRPAARPRADHNGRTPIRATIAADGSNRDRYIGVEAPFVTWEGETKVGRITEVRHGMYPIVTFPDGRWARLNRSFVYYA